MSFAARLHRVATARFRRATAARALVVAAALAAGGCTSLPPNPFAPMHPQWSDYQSRQARHYANFPGKSKQSLRETKMAGGQTAATYLRELQLGERYYGTAWTQVPGAPSSPEASMRLLEVAAAEALKSGPGAKLVYKQVVKVDNIPGLEYVIDLPQTKTRLRQQIFMVTGVLVEQTYSGPAGTESEREPGRFFDSLKLLP